jgi:hypothetical protein
MDAKLADKANSADVYTKGEIDTALDGISGEAGSIATQINTALEPYSTTAEMNTELAKKQNSLTEAQLSAVNSGIDATKVGQIATNKADIASLYGVAQVMDEKLTLKANQNYVETELGTLSNAVQSKQNVIDAEHPLSAGLVDGLAKVATTGDYDDLTNTPSIPDVSGFATTPAMNTALADKADKSAVEELAGTVATNTTNIATNAGKITELQGVVTTNAQNVADALALKANAADVYAKTQTYSKTEIDAELQSLNGGVGSIGAQIDEKLADYTTTADLESNYALKTELPTIDSALSLSSTNPVQNKVVSGALDDKVPFGTVPTPGQYVLGFVDGVQMYIPIVDANGNSGSAIVAATGQEP